MDLNLLPLARRAGQDGLPIPGLYLAPQPRRPARGRQSDRLVLYLVLQGNSSLAVEQQAELLARLAQGYYKTPGAVTSAMRTVAETLNQYLLDRNLRSASGGLQATGLLSMIVLREDRLYLGQCGPMHAFIITTGGLRQFYEEESSNRGLGVSRATHVTYSQASLNPYDLLLVSPDPPATWATGGLTGVHGQGPESLRRRLLSQAGTDFEAVLALASTGPGKIHLLSPSAGSTANLTPIPPGEAPAATREDAGPAAGRAGEAGAEKRAATYQAPSPIVPPAAPGLTEVTSAAENPLPGAPVETRPVPPWIEEEAWDRAETPEAPSSAPLPEPPTGSPVETRATAVRRETPAPEAATPVPPTPPAPASSAPTREASPAGPVERVQTPAPETPASPPRRRPGSRPLVRVLAALARGLNRLSSGFARLAGAVLRRLLPGEGTLPSSVMAFFAIAVPITVVAVATFVYVQEGVTKQYAVLYSQASQEAEQARAATDPQERRQAWQEALAVVNQVESYQVTTDSQALRAEAQSVFDELDGVRRLDYQPAISRGLPATARIARIVVTDNDLYLLNATDGSVWRALLTGRGYELDNNFRCSPSLPGSQAAGTLIDIAAIPKGSELEADLLAVDASGSLLLCTPGEQPQSSALAPPPAGWGNPIGLTLDSGNLYVLDPQKNAVWVYWNVDFQAQPQLFFAEDVPPMEDVIDLAVDKSDLYLLHADGHITLCTFSDWGVAPTRCADPVPYSDSRPGNEGQMFKPEHPFTQILTTQPPDPSLYLLESQSQAIYHFSLRLLSFQRQMRPQDQEGGFPEDPATAFALSPDKRVAFMAVGNQVYYGGMP